MLLFSLALVCDHMHYRRRLSGIMLQERQREQARKGKKFVLYKTVQYGRNRDVRKKKRKRNGKAKRRENVKWNKRE